MLKRVLTGFVITIGISMVVILIIGLLIGVRYQSYIRLLESVVADEETTYLIFFQNALELRPTGGFLGNFVEVTVENRQLKEYRMISTNEFDEASPGIGVPSPDGFRDLLPEITQQQLRDSNWDPDFPTSAEHMIMLYEMQGGEADVSGVVAIDSHILPVLLEQLGPVYLETLGGDPVTSEDVLWRVQYDTNWGFWLRGTERGERKEALVELVNEIESRIRDLSWRELFRLANVLEDVASRKHIMAYFQDEEAQSLIEEFGWDGGINQDEEYFFQLVDANLGGLKADFFMERDISFDLSECEKGICGEVTIVYRNTAEESSVLNDVYKTYSRVYLPEDAFITEITGIERDGRVDYSVEHNRKVGGYRLLVPVNQSREVVIRYHQPRGEGDIVLFIAKQAGILEQNVTVLYNGIEQSFVMDRDVRIPL